MSYTATVARLTNVRPHGNADRIQLATVMGEQVIIGLDNGDGDLGLFFPTDGQLSHEFTLQNHLYNKSSAEKLSTGATKFGFFDANRRVRAQTFRGQRSEGFWIPLGEINPMVFPSAQLLAEGTALTEIDGHEICAKYLTKGTLNAAQGQSRSVLRGETKMFPKHYDTDQFRHKWEEIPEGSIIYLTEKLHGTSARIGRVKDNFVGWRKIIHDLVGLDLRPWTVLNGSRRVILEHSDGTGYYGDDRFRLKPLEGLELRKGEVLYGELVGWVNDTTPIMPAVKVDKKELPEIATQYGPEMTYKYGTVPGQVEFYLYRIVQMNEDGEGVDLSWPQVKRRAEQLGLKIVLELGNDDTDSCGMFIWHKRLQGWAKQMIEDMSHGPSLLDHSHIREGVAIRIETPTGHSYCLKEKSFEFKVLEGIIKSKDTYVDVEESA